MKSPVCNADLGRSIDRPVCKVSFSTVDGVRVDSLMSAPGNRGGERLVSTIGLRANVLLS